MGNRQHKQSGSWKDNIAALFVIAVCAVVAFELIRDHRYQVDQAWAQAQVTQAQVDATSRAGWQASSAAKRIEDCTESWRVAFSYYWAPRALVLTNDSLIGYFLDGEDTQSLRPARCSATGVQREPRIERPLRDRIAAEQISNENDASAWSFALNQLGTEAIAGDLLAIELIVDPLDGAVWRRDWRGLEGGAAPTLKRLTENGLTPASAVAIPLLFEPAFPLRAGADPGPVHVLPVIDWLGDPNRIVDFLAKRVQGRGISEISLSDSMLTVQTVGSTPAFDGAPPAPFGERSFDEFGIANASFWYPREIAGFGCTQGATIPALRESLQAAWHGGRLASIWYSCSPAHGDGSSGQWTLQTK